ncbi:hypothetical protein TeGR_g1872, partial [Tetraparma gracilis]
MASFAFTSGVTALAESSLTILPFPPADPDPDPPSPPSPPSPHPTPPLHCALLHLPLEDVLSPFSSLSVSYPPPPPPTTVHECLLSMTTVWDIIGRYSDTKDLSRAAV